MDGASAGQFLPVLAYAALPVLGNYAGGVLAERVPMSGRALSLALHAATGVVIAIVAVELMPSALAVANPWVVLVSFVIGGLFLMGLDHVTAHVAERFGSRGATGRVTSWSIFIGVALDLFSDGVMIGAGGSLDLRLGLLLAIGQVPADVPHGFATIASFRSQGVSPARRRLLMVALALPILAGATLGYFGVRGRPEWVKMAVLAFTAGALTTLLMEEIVPEAHEQKEGRLAAFVFLAGFALFFAVSILFE